MKTLQVVKSLTVLMLVIFTIASYGVELDVPFKAQVPPGNWDFTKNCGPTSILMVAAYHLGFTPTEQYIKDLDDWMVVEGIIPSINSYNAHTTDGDDLVQIAQEYYGFQQVAKTNSSSISYLRQVLLDDNSVIVGVRLNMVNYVTNNNGHFMVLTGIVDDNGDGVDDKVFVNDPGHFETNGGHHKDYPISTFLASWATQSYCSIIIDSSAGRSNIIAQKVDGSVNPEILAAYGRHGGQQAFGNPVSNLVPYSDGYVTEWSLFSDCLFQVFNGGVLGKCAIVYDTQNSPDEAFPMHGQIWQFYKANSGPTLLLAGNLRIGGPIESERYATDDHNGHQLVVQEMANGYMIYDTVDGFVDARLEQDGYFTFTLTPTLSGWPMSDTQIYVSGNLITDAVRYTLYRNGQYIADLNSNIEYIDSGLTPDISYSYQARALDSSGSILTESDSITIRTKPTPPIQSSSIQLTLQAGTTMISASWSLVENASWYEVILDGSSYNTVSDLFCNIYGVSSGVHTVQVKAFAPTGELLGQSSTKSVNTAQNLVVTTTGPSVIGPDQQGEVIYTFHNTYPQWISGAIYRIIQSSNSWLTPRSNTFPDVSIPPNGTAQLTIQFTTGSDYLNASDVTLAIYVVYNGSFGSLTQLSRGGRHTMKIEPSIDLGVSLPTQSATFQTGQMVYTTPTMTNNGNQVSPPSRLELELDTGATWQTIASVMVPSLKARESWQQVIPVGIFDAPGEYYLGAVIDPLDEITEPVEENKIAVTSFTVVQPAIPDYTITNIYTIPAQPVTGQNLKVVVVCNNQGDADGFAAEVGLIYNNLLLKQPLSPLTTGQTAETVFNLGTPSRPGTGIWRAIISTEFDEKDQANNKSQITIVVVEPPRELPDIMIEEIVFNPSQPINTSPFTATAKIVNQGNGPAGSCQLRLLLRNLIYSWTIEEVNLSVPTLQPGEEILISHTFNGSWMSRPYPYRVSAQVDYGSEVEELDETNNSLLSAFFVPQKPLPDLVVDENSYVFYNWGSVYFFMLSIENVGSSATGSFDVTGEIPELGLTFPHPKRTIPEPGSYRLFVFYPVPPVSESITLRIIIDPDNKVLESDESNNIYEKIVDF